MSQVGNFISEAQKIVGAPDPALQQLPRVPFQTDLKLTREQEQKMIDRAFKRYGQISQEMGRDKAIQPNWWMNQAPSMNAALAAQGLQPYETFLGKRSRYEAMYANDVAWRPYTFGPNNIFYSSNLSIPLVRRICSQMIAKARNAFFGTDPWFSITPSPVQEQTPEVNAQRVQKIEQFLRFKLGESQSDSQVSGARAITRAIILGECPVKTSYVIRDQIFNVTATVLHSVEDGGVATPVKGQDGNYVTEHDQFVDAQDGQGTQVLARDGQTQMPLAPVWQKIPLDRRQVLFEGTKSEPIYYKDFGCPMTATDEQTADCIYHLYDKPVMEFVDLVVKRGMVDDTAPDRLLAAQKMLAVVKQMASNSPQPKSAENVQTRPNENYLQGPSAETGGPISEFIEFYMWYDANGDGVAENIMLICDKVTQAPIFYDHVANVTTDGLRPIKIVRVFPVEGRWYGAGIAERFENYQNIVDLLVNRWNFSQSRSGRVDFWSPTMTQEGDRDPDLKMNYGQTYTVKPGMDPEKVLHSVYLNDIKFEKLKEQIDMFMQMCVNEAGVLNANDAQSAGLASSDLATGILQIQQSGDELFAPILQDLKPGLQAVLDREVDVTLANMNPTEVFSFLDGDTMGIDQITPDDVRGLKFRTQITLTNQKNQQQIASCQAVTALVEKFYLLQPLVQQRTAELYRQQIRTIDPRVDAMKAIQPVEPQPEPAPKKASVAVTLKGEDLSPEQKDELLETEFAVVPNPQARPTVASNGSTEKLGSFAPSTEFQSQLTQRANKKAS